MSIEADITIVGAGVVGLAIAAEVACAHRQVYVIEKNESFGQETSARNSQVIHAGIYYPEGSLKAQLCVEGNSLLYQLCETYDIGHQKLGKLIVAANTQEIDQLHAIIDKGRKNGARGLTLLSRKQLKNIEPNIEARAAILSPSTGIIDVCALMSSFYGRAREHGARIVCRTELVAIEQIANGYRITAKDPAGSTSFTTSILINCAGLTSDRIANMTGLDIAQTGYKLHYCKGEYFGVGNGKNKLINKLIYPVRPQDRASLGIHATLDMDGIMRLGPNAKYVDTVDYAVDISQQQAFYNSAKKFIPFIEYDDLYPDMAGIRPKLQESGGEERDFVIRHENDRGLPGLINLIGIESPGLTASPAIANYVGCMVNEIL